MPRSRSLGRWARPAWVTGWMLLSCGGQDPTAEPWAGGEALTFRSEVEPVRSVDEALAGVFIPPFVDCRERPPGERGQAPDGRVCTPVAISGCTEEGKYFPAYASCAVVRTQRPYWPAPPAAMSAAEDPRLADPAFMDELAWAARQVEASGCACCHDSREIAPSQWDIRAAPIWLDSLSDSGLALFIGLADSSVLGAYPPSENHGFQRDITGIPSTDAPRMQALLRAEMARRGIGEAEAAAVPPFGGPIYDNRVAKPTECGADEGVEASGTVKWKGGPARYIYLTDADAENPGVPPNLDLPEGTRWRLDVLASQPALASGLPFGTTPPGSVQAYPVLEAARRLERGARYRLYVLRDVGIPLANCTFQFGAAGATDQAGGGADSQPRSDVAPTTTCGPDETEATFGRPCTDSQTHADCGCAADYCAIQPGQTTGVCTATGCIDDPSVCPIGWSCLDLSRFAPSAPPVCVADN